MEEVIGRCEALFDFQARNEKELSLKKGEIFAITQKNRSWWRGQTIDGARKGFFPSNYVKELENEPNETCATSPPPPQSNEPVNNGVNGSGIGRTAAEDQNAAALSQSSPSFTGADYNADSGTDSASSSPALAHRGISQSAPSPKLKRTRDKKHVLGDPLPGRYPWSKTYICSCGARLPSPEVANLHIKNFSSK